MSTDNDISTEVPCKIQWEFLTRLTTQVGHRIILPLNPLGNEREI